VDEGPSRKLLKLLKAMDDGVNILPKLRIGIGPKGLFIPAGYSKNRLNIAILQTDREMREFNIKVLDDTHIRE